MKLNHRSTKLLQALIGAIVFGGLTIPTALWLSRHQSRQGNSYSEGIFNRFSADYSRRRNSTQQESYGANAWQNSSGQLGNDVLYYVMVDRFADGDRGNNRPFIPDSIPANPSQRQIEQRLSDASYDPNHRLFGLFFGGDLQGVRQRLPYLKQLGVTKIVLSPIQEGPPGFINDRNANLYLDNGDGSRDRTGRSTLTTNYHGYWLRDWFRIDPHYRRTGSSPDDFSDLRGLLNDAKAMGMGVLLDLTVHQASMHHLQPGEYPGVNTQQFQNVFVSDSAIRRSGKTLARWSTPPKNPNDSWYDLSCVMNYQRPNSSMLDSCLLAPGLPTLNHSNPAMEAYLLDAAEFWLTLNPGGAQLQGFRIDAAKNLSPTFLRKLVKRVRGVNPKAILFAENFGFGSQSPQTTDLIRSVGDVSVIDFDFTESARAYFSGDRSWFGHRSNLESAANGRVLGWQPFSLLPPWLTNPANLLRPMLPSNTEAAKSWVTYLHEHDIPALRTFRPGMNDAEYSALIAFLMTARGVPMITWGGEIGISVPPMPRNNGLNGMGGDPFTRPMMLFPGQRGYNPALANLTRRMVDLRRRYPVLRYGDTAFLRDRFNPFVGQTILMLRRPSQAGSPKLDPTSVVYGFSPNGGRYTINLKQALNTKGPWRSCDSSDNRCQAIQDPSTFQLNLKAGQFKVLVLTPSKG
jgi:glycosidase